MAIFSFKSPKIYIDGLDLSGVSNDCKLDYEADELDVTTFASGGTKTRIAGMLDSKLSASGFADFTTTTPTYEATTQAMLGSQVSACVMPTGIAEGNVAFVSGAMGGSYQTFGKIGEAAPFSLDLKGSLPLVRGTVLASNAGTSTLTTGTGSVTQLGATSSTQSIYCQLHVVSIGGTATPTLTVTVKSAALVGFGSPTTRASFTARTTVGAQRIVVAGPVTDQYWRVDYAVSGTTPSFAFVAVVGIQ